MKIFSSSLEALLQKCFLLSLIFVGFCLAEEKTVEVVGVGECTDCALNGIKTSHAFSGLRVAIDCKAADGHFKTSAVGELNEEGNFKVSLPKELLKEGNALKEECYAQLHSASATPCAAQDGLKSNKIVFKSTTTDGVQTFGVAGGKLKFSPVTCASAFFWKHHLYPPLPKVFPPKVPIFKKPFPPHKPIFHKPLPPLVPIYKKPLPPPVPTYKPKPHPFLKPHPPIPIYKPKPHPFLKPHPPIPIYKPKPHPPIPIYKPKPHPFLKPHPPIPIYKPKPHPFFKPLPPLPPLHPKYYFPHPKKYFPHPKKYFPHPKIGFPPLAPFVPQHP